MPRPKEGYRNAAGQPIPGTHDPINRFMDRSALMNWAWRQGKDGKALYARDALDIGTCVHTMIELDLQATGERDIRFYAGETLKAPDDLAKATAAFGAWRTWKAQHQVQVLVQEVPLVSQKYQYGGTPDLIAYVDGLLTLLDFKTSAKGDVYPDKLLALAAHGKLWTENNPDKPLIGGYRLIMLPKDGSGVQPHHYMDLKPHWKLFKLYLKAYHMDKVCSDRRVLKGSPTIAPEVVAPKAPRRPASKPQDRVAQPTYHQASTVTMAELLRAYGHAPAIEGVHA